MPIHPTPANASPSHSVTSTPDGQVRKAVAPNVTVGEGPRKRSPRVPLRPTLVQAKHERTHAALPFELSSVAQPSRPPSAANTAMAIGGSPFHLRPSPSTGEAADPTMAAVSVRGGGHTPTHRVAPDADRDADKFRIAYLAKTFLLQNKPAALSMAQLSGKPAFVLVDIVKARAYLPDDVVLHDRQRPGGGAGDYTLSAAGRSYQAVCLYPALSHIQVLGNVGDLLTHRSPLRRLLASSLISAPVRLAEDVHTDAALFKCALAAAAFGLGVVVQRDESVANALAFPLYPDKRVRAFTMAAFASAFCGDDTLLQYCLDKGADPFGMVLHEGVSVADALVKRNNLTGVKMVIPFARSRIDAASLWALLDNPKVATDDELVAMLHRQIKFLYERA